MRRNWGILGTGRIAGVFASALAESQTGRLVAAGSRTPETARAFAGRHGCRAHSGYAALVADPEVEFVYISLPNHLHLQWVLECAHAGKHVLCEKPFTLNAFEASVALEACRAAGVFCMEAFMYRCHPQTAELAKLISDGAIGDLRFIDAVFGFDAGSDYAGGRLGYADGGGSIMDVGCYPVSMARLITGESPLKVEGTARVGATGVDEVASASLLYPSGVVARLASAVRANLGGYVRIVGSSGEINLAGPWIPPAGTGEIEVSAGGRTWIVQASSDRNVYALEADVCGRSADAGQAPERSWDETLGDMRVLDAWRSSAGVQWPSEREGSAHVRPRKRASVPMTYGTVPGVEKPVSRLILGTIMMQAGAVPLADALLDSFFEMGGTTLDTARVYHCEPSVGRWIDLRGMRDEIVLIAKGAHPAPGDPRSRVTPEEITADLTASMEDLRTSWFDLYVLHRDDPDVPVAEIVDCLDEHRRAGRIRAYGGSNWTAARLQAAQDYAATHGRAGFSVSSPNLSLAVSVEVPWPGCLSISGNSEELDWYARTRMPLLAWSSQAQGWFTGRPETPELTRCWGSQANRERKRRCAEIGAKLGFDANQVALAWLLHQPQDVYPLIGPWSVAELANSVDALRIKLDDDQVSYLSLQR